MVAELAKHDVERLTREECGFEPGVTADRLRHPWHPVPVVFGRARHDDDAARGRLQPDREIDRALEIERYRDAGDAGAERAPAHEVLADAEEHEGDARPELGSMAFGEGQGRGPHGHDQIEPHVPVLASQQGQELRFVVREGRSSPRPGLRRGTPPVAVRAPTARIAWPAPAARFRAVEVAAVQHQDAPGVVGPFLGSACGGPQQVRWREPPRRPGKDRCFSVVATSCSRSAPALAQAPSLVRAGRTP